MKRPTDISLPTKVLDIASQNALMTRMNSFKEALEEDYDISVNEVNVCASFDSDHVSIIVIIKHNHNIRMTSELSVVFVNNVSLNVTQKSYECIGEEEGLYEMVFEMPVVKQKLSIDF